ncbi:efflux RND transporter periplasmic adaptor subunit [Aquabacter spiritensis]|uniref:RND family efflux transporter MFP subunit n=1 Tax=Aquabacter spiritensis TaxID=933073 RepID=A0A4R3M020_9HYPH|nr:efflux RND transporter periplasmic adaptor subunit [Aquabacter spiritensis]TCT04405.1 RND family efflux transporter MFP subunit [Aquabacter spiritensis]
MSAPAAPVPRAARFALPFWRLLPGLGAAAFLAGCGDPAPAEQAGPPPRPVQVVEVALEPATAARSFVGVIRARREIDQSFRVGGKLAERRVEVGDTVAAGQVIARLDPVDLALQLESAEAELAAATAALAQTAAEDQRTRTLTQRGFASTADLDRKSLAKDEAVGRLERAKRALDLARNQHAYADLVAAADGVVVAVSAEPGQVLVSGQSVARIARLDEKEAAVALPETALAEARAARATVTLWADPGRAYAAHLRELAPQAETVSRTYAARFALADADPAMALGMTATVTLTPADAAQVARLPLAAVFDRGAGPHVFVVDPESRRIAARKVAVAGYTAEAVLIADGLAPGERVVAMGVQTLDPGRAVRTVAAR